MEKLGLAPTLRGMLAYTIWADRQVLEALADVPADELARESGTSFGSILGTAAHILLAEQVWLARILGNPPESYPGEGEYPDLPALAAGFVELWPQLEFLLASITEDQLATDFSWVNMKGESHTAPLRQVILHFANHATYHRGQIVAMLRELGREPPSTDLVYWRGSI